LWAKDSEIAFTVAAAIAHNWYNRSRFREAELLCLATLKLGEDFRILHALARSEKGLGKTAAAQKHYEDALLATELVEDSQRERSGLLCNLATLVAQQGDIARSLDLWNQSLTIDEAIGDVKGKAATLSNMAEVIAQQGDIARALDLWNQSLTILEAIGDVQGKAATLHN